LNQYRIPGFKQQQEQQVQQENGTEVVTLEMKKERRKSANSYSFFSEFALMPKSQSECATNLRSSREALLVAGLSLEDRVEMERMRRELQESNKQYELKRVEGENRGSEAGEPKQRTKKKKKKRAKTEPESVKETGKSKRKSKTKKGTRKTDTTSSSSSGKRIKKKAEKTGS